jgi:hypothetical protein
MEDRIKYIHYYKGQVSNKRLDELLDYFLLYSRKGWLILLEEKLRRAELEIFIA